jgi:Domain of unknown function (DUF5667)
MSVRDREDAVIARLQSLAPHLDGEPDPEFRAATRARLVAMAAVRTPAPEPVSPLRRLLTEGAGAPARWRTRLTAGLAGAALAVTALATVVAVASEARPGDVLYDLKRGTEETKLALAGDARGQTLLDLASTRLDEVRALVDSGATALPAAGSSVTGETVLAAGADAALVVETLETMDAQTAEGAAWLTDRAVTTEDAGPLELLADWAAGQSEELAALRDDAPAAATDDVDDSLVLLSDIATRVSGLDSSLDCPAGPATAGADELGPVPALCVPEASTSPAVPGGSGGGDGSSASDGAPATDVPVLPQPQPRPSVPSVGGTVPGLPGGTESGGGQTSDVPPLPTDIVPTPTLPSVSLSVPRLPGASAPVPTPTSGTSGTPLPTLEVCLGPVAIGNC